MKTRAERDEEREILERVAKPVYITDKRDDWAVRQAVRILAERELARYKLQLQSRL